MILSPISFSFQIGGNLHTSTFTNTHRAVKALFYTKNISSGRTEHSGRVVIKVPDMVLIVWLENHANTGKQLSDPI